MASSPPAGTEGALGVPPAADQPTDHDGRFLLDGQVLGLGDRFRAQVTAELWADIDGHVPRATPDLFASQHDYRQPWWMVYSLSAEWRRSGMIELARFGRQITEHGLPLTFDGAAVELRPWGRQVSVFAFGGRTIHFFETQLGAFENWVASAGAVFRASENLRLEVDWRMLNETVPSAERNVGAHVSNHAVGAVATLRSNETLGKVFARSIDGRLSHVGAALTTESVALRSGIDARLHMQLVTLGELAESENPFFSILGPSLPHLRFKVEGWKDFDMGQGSTLSLHLGWRLRQLLEGEPTRFNRNMAGIYFQSGLHDILARGLYITGIAEMNYVPWSPFDDWSLTFGASGGYANKVLKAEVGSYFQQFKVNYYQVVEELQDVRTVYGTAGYRVMPWLDLRARYQLELVDRYIHSAHLTMRQEF